MRQCVAFMLSLGTSRPETYGEKVMPSKLFVSVPFTILTPGKLVGVTAQFKNAYNGIRFHVCKGKSCNKLEITKFGKERGFAFRSYTNCNSLGEGANCSEHGSVRRLFLVSKTFFVFLHNVPTPF